jgi:hypothetical protein
MFKGLFGKSKSGMELRKVQTKATFDSCRELENDLVEVSIHPTDCEICMKYEGRIFSISGKHPIYPKLVNMPPFHPDCRHSILPTSEEAIEVVTRMRGTYESTLARQIREERERKKAEAKR